MAQVQLASRIQTSQLIFTTIPLLVILSIKSGIHLPGAAEEAAMLHSKATQPIGREMHLPSLLVGQPPGAPAQLPPPPITLQPPPQPLEDQLHLAGLKDDALGAALVQEAAAQLLPSFNFSTATRFQEAMQQGACSLGELRQRELRGKQADQSSLQAAQTLVLRIDHLEDDMDRLQQEQRAAVQQGQFARAQQLQGELSQRRRRLAELEARVSEAFSQADLAAQLDIQLLVDKVQEHDRMLLELRVLDEAARQMIRQLEREADEAAATWRRVASDARSDVAQLSELAQGLGVRQQLAAAEKNALQRALSARAELGTEGAALDRLLDEEFELLSNKTAADGLAAGASQHVSLLQRRLHDAVLQEDYAKAARLHASLEMVQQGAEEARHSGREFQRVAGAQQPLLDAQRQRYLAQRRGVLAAVELLHEARQLRKVFLEGNLPAQEVQQRLAEAGLA